MLSLSYTLKGQGLNYGYPLIQNFTSKQFQVGNINWCSTQDEVGNMFFANKNGVLKYDGNHWSSIETLKEAISISYDSITKTVYVGCVNDFGYIKIDNSGKSVYISLSERLKQKDNVGMVWDCFSTSRGVFFLTENHLFRYHKGLFKTWNSQSNFHAAFSAGDKIFVREKGIGLFCLDGDFMSFIEGSELFAEVRVSFIDVDKSNPNEFILASREKGLYKFELQKNKSNYSIKLALINKSLADLFNKNIIYNGKRLSDNNLAFSTLLGGLIIIDTQGNLKAQLNTKNGLNCDLVNHVFEDKQGNLWLSTENGISLVMYNLPTYNFQNSGNISGTIESIAKLGNKIYVATSTGIYNFNQHINQFEKSDFPSIQVWQLTKAEHEEALLATTTNGIYKITSSGYKLLSDAIEKTFTIHKSRKHANIYYLGHFNGFATFKYENGQLVLINKNPNINSSVRSILEDEIGNLWLSTESDGIIYMLASESSISNKNNYINFIRYTTDNGLPNLNANFVYDINNEIVVATYDGLYHLNKKDKLSNYSINDFAKLQFTRYPDIDPYNSKGDIQILKLKQDSKKNIWITSLFPSGKYDIGYLKNNAKPKEWINDPFKIISKDKIDEFFLDEEYSWFGGPDMIYCFNNLKKFNYKYPYNSIVHTVISNSDTIFNGNYYKAVLVNNKAQNQMSLIQPEELIKSFPYHNNDFTFHFSGTSFIADNPSKFSCILEGEDEKWSEWSNETFKTYMNLYEGKYVFKVKAKNIFGTESTIGTYEFKIHPPWYRTLLAYILYLVLAIGLVWAVVIVYTRSLNRIIKNQTAELQKQKDEIVHKNKEITDSIYYAKRIQDAIMPSNEYIKNMFTDSFVFFKPKDIVSGDFYWANLRDNNAILAAVDCTGHGVPGAFMSMMGNDYLNDIIVDSKINEPHEILNRMRAGIIKALKQRGESGESKDGMDMSLVNVDKSTLMLEYAGANNPIYIVRDKNQPEIANSILFSGEHDKKNLYEIKGNKFPVGIHMGTTLQPFSKHNIQLVKGDVFYMFSDGYADQFGGPSAKKLKYNQFKKFILESMFLTMEEQKIYLEQKLNDWQGELEQVDDVLVIGVRIV